jgi:hypothetical protein
MATDLQTVKLHGYSFPDWQFTFNLATAAVKGDISKPVTLDTSGANKMKPGADNTPIDGVLLSYEDRTIEGIKVGTVALKFAAKFAVKAADALAVGDTAICAGGGEVRKWISGTDAAVPARAANVVTEVSGGFATVVKQ